MAGICIGLEQERHRTGVLMGKQGFSEAGRVFPGAGVSPQQDCAGISYKRIKGLTWQPSGSGAEEHPAVTVLERVSADPGVVLAREHLEARRTRDQGQILHPREAECRSCWTASSRTL